MVITPQIVDKSDADWANAVALMQVLALDPRRSPQRGRAFRVDADEFLMRPTVTVDRRQVPAPYCLYHLDFAVSCVVMGQIPVEDVKQLAEFRKVVNEALDGSLTTAERLRWEAHYQGDQEGKEKAGNVAERHYREVQSALIAARDRMPSHQDVLEGLINVGSSMLEAKRD